MMGCFGSWSTSCLLKGNPTLSYEFWTIDPPSNFVPHRQGCIQLYCVLLTIALISKLNGLAEQLVAGTPPEATILGEPKWPTLVFWNTRKSNCKIKYRPCKLKHHPCKLKFQPSRLKQLGYKSWTSADLLPLFSSNTAFHIDEAKWLKPLAHSQCFSR